jgi:hypothetical protein
MDKYILTDEPVENRRKILKDSCDRVVEFSYMKRFTAEQLRDMERDLAETMLQLDKLERELEEVKNEYKENMKPYKTSVTDILANLRYKAKLTSEECYIIFEEDMAGVYNGEGELVHHRPLEASERQRTLFSVQRNKSAIL